MRKQEQIIKAKIEELTGFDDIFLRSRKKERFICRVAFSNFVRKYSTLNTTQIGDMMGYKNKNSAHSNVIYMTSQFEPLLKFEPLMQNLWKELMNWYASESLKDYIKPEIKGEIKPLFNEKLVFDIITELEDFSLLDDVLTKLKTIIKATNQMNRVTHQIK